MRNYEEMLTTVIGYHYIRNNFQPKKKKKNMNLAFFTQATLIV